VTALRGRVLPALALAGDRQCVVDSVPVPVMGYPLVPGAHNAGTGRSWGADVGGIASKKQHLFGYRLHLLVTVGGVIRDYVLAPASAHDVAVAPGLLEGHNDLVVVGDKGYLSAPLAETLRRERFIPALKGACPPSWCGGGRGEGTICHQGTKTLGNEPNQTCFS